MILRLTEKAKHIVHIPRVLYYWRVHAGSVASGVRREALLYSGGEKGFAGSYGACRIKKERSPTPKCLPLTKINYELDETPLISI